MNPLPFMYFYYFLFLLSFRMLLKHGVHYLLLPTCSLIIKVQICPSSTIFNGVLPDHQFPCPLNEKSVLCRTWAIKMKPVAKYISLVEITYHHLMICNLITVFYILSPKVNFFPPTSYFRKGPRTLFAI
uniref:Uncharacterized protein n=1 Tax=Pipistrellus kuhlii TaxID=59472 RepID=A0A7J7UM76_PIPKU|nr:hypothetical protein mPipKuh1_008755 [Pipistrellus kuhlii]